MLKEICGATFFHTEDGECLEITARIASQRMVEVDIM